MKELFQNLLDSYAIRDITNENLSKAMEFIKETLQMERQEPTQERESEGQEIE